MLFRSSSQGVPICHCGSEKDAIMMLSFGDGRTYRRLRLIEDQVIDITAEVNGQLPGQLGLPKGQDQLSGMENLKLKENQDVPFIV